MVEAGLSWEPVEGWRITRQVAQPSLRAKRGEGSGDPFVERLLGAGPFILTERLAAEPEPKAPSRSPASVLRIQIEPAAGEACVVVMRHASDALTFHTSAVPPRGHGATERTVAARKLRFSLPLPARQESHARRGAVRKIVRVFVLRTLAPLADRGLPRLAAHWEAARFSDGNLEPGWLKVTARGLASGVLETAELTRVPAPPARSLLLLHGILSDAGKAFGDLAETRGASGQSLFPRLQKLYGDRIFAFNHRTLSQTPEENARELLAALPDRPLLFDVLTHSRGGIVLRTLVERRAVLGPEAARFQLGRAVTVATPNGGSPLASPDQWKQLVGWVANLIDLFPKNPFSLGLGFVVEALVWMARRALGTLPGIAALAPGSETLAALQASNASLDSYAALVASFKPGSSLMARMRDAGVHRFFGSANDLVVPTEGGWQLGATSGGGASRAIAAGAIGCFGPDGNLTASADAVHHVNFFAAPRSVDFIAETLLGLPRSNAPFVPAPTTSIVSTIRGSTTRVPAETPPQRDGKGISPRKSSCKAFPGTTERFELVLLGSPDGTPGGQLMASYGGARVVEPFATKGGEAGERMRRLIATHERILASLEGRSERALPGGPELIVYGKLLFETLFPGEIRRLYDAARARGPSPLDLVFTSTLAWLADKPWEFAYDAARGSFLAIEDVHFVRGVLTPVPAETLRPRNGPLRILVAAAQPLGTVLVSTKEEEKVIRRGFAPLIQEGLVTLDFVRALTPERLHDRMTTRRFDVLHFIGHGSYDERKRVGSLLFQDDKGHARSVDARALRQLLCGRGLSLVVLNACETARGGRVDFNRGVAPSLVAGGIPAVIGNQYPVLDASATAFSRRFYAALAAGHSLGQSAREARIAVSYQTPEASMDWAVPVLYARDPDAVICRPPAPARKKSRAPAQKRASRTKNP